MMAVTKWTVSCFQKQPYFFWKFATFHSLLQHIWTLISQTFSTSSWHLNHTCDCMAKFTRLTHTWTRLGVVRVLLRSYLYIYNTQLSNAHTSFHIQKTFAYTHNKIFYAQNQILHRSLEMYLSASISIEI